MSPIGGGGYSRCGGWSPCPAGQLGGASDSFVAVSDGLEDLGLSRSDARTLSQTVLTELAENVECLSADNQPPVVLVGAIWLSAPTYSHRQKDLPPYLLQIAERALADGGNVLRLIVADPGAALAARLATVPVLGSGLLDDMSGLWWVTRAGPQLPRCRSGADGGPAGWGHVRP